MERNYISSWDVFYGKILYQNSYSTLNSFSQFQFNNPVDMVGINLSAEVTNNKYSEGGWPAQFFLGMVLPEEIFLQDTIKVKLSGYLVGLNIFGYDFLYKSKKFDLNISTGINTGRLKISHADFKQRNSLFAPQVSLVFKTKIKKISFVLEGEFQYDISDKEWYKLHFSKESILPVSAFRQTGCFFRISVGKVIGS